jgi:acetyltransferase-like isoleucine patch superfamily enzyme
VIHSLLLKYRFSKYNLQIDYLATAYNCSFGQRNTLHEKACLWNVILGNFTYIGENSRIARTKIGKYCSIGPNVLCGLGKHPSRDFVSIHPIFYSTQNPAQITFSDANYFAEYEPIEIGSDVWVGANAIILDGVKIGDGAIISAGTVVTGDVEPYSIIGGVPGRLIRFRFEAEEIKFLQEFKWWDRDEQWLRKNFKLFHDIKSFMRTCGEIT